ncbi:DUF4126 family protein [Mucilaginibacter sp. CAU 1740]|uniref:DUF4126 family protein n=1 Tax=Mucilaginibacter sp. CAU 1740 TaxID=3140365 RepID=UPI00325B771D
MKSTPSKQILQATALGILAGMRTTAAMVAATHILSRGRFKRLGGSPLRFMQSPTVATVCKVISVSEIVVDKLPSTPNRTEPGGVIGRSLSGALAGAAICKAAGGKALTGALIGGATAIASTYAGYFLRKNIVKSSHIPDPVIGGVEDILTIGAGVTLCANA